MSKSDKRKTNRPRGRPVKKPDDIQGVRRRVSFTEAEYTEIKTVAKAKGMTVANWMRQAILRAVTRAKREK